MLVQRLLLPVGATTSSVTATVLARATTPFSCSGGSIYFDAHPVDALLFQNPNLHHDLWVFKCVTALTFTTGDRRLADNTSFALEDGLAHAFLQMTGMPVYVKNQSSETTDVRMGDHDVAVWTPRFIPDFHINYLRLSDGGHAGHGHDAHGGELLKKLWNRDIDNITTTNGNVTYTLELLQDLVATVLRVRQPNDIKIMHHEAVLPEDENDDEAEHADHHSISAKLVMDVIERENITANVQT
ncbi:hypothetical protein NX059_004771 [Plenodomus lindquistii]|nr:hypothetical protein NX059_004771 [Plenodomus lindquistii]